MSGPLPVATLPRLTGLSRMWHNPAMNDIGRIFEARSVAIVGVSSNQFSVTNVNFLAPLVRSGYRGRIYPINPSMSEVMGLRTYPSLAALPETPDYVICAVPAGSVAALLRECAEARVRVVCVFSAGFSETGQEAAKLERELVKIAREGGVRLIGPNCMGVHCPKSGIVLDGDMEQTSGDVGFISQSGGNSQDTILSLAARQVFISKLVSFGNAADLNESDFLEYLGSDADTRIIGIYMEGIKEPSRFIPLAREIARRKPLIVLKGGRSDAGREAVSLHTGALAGSRVIWDTLCRQAGILQVHSIKEMTETIQAFHYVKPPRGRRVGIIGVGGGANVLAADECESAGLRVPVLSAEVKEKLREFTPHVGTGLRNPVDTLTDFYLDPPVLARTYQILAGWEGVDLLLVVFPTLLGGRLGVERLTAGMGAVIEASRSFDKPLGIILRTSGYVEGERLGWEALRYCNSAGVPVFWSFRDAALAMGHLASYRQRAEAMAED